VAYLHFFLLPELRGGGKEKKKFIVDYSCVGGEQSSCSQRLSWEKREAAPLPLEVNKEERGRERANEKGLFNSSFFILSQGERKRRRGAISYTRKKTDFHLFTPVRKGGRRKVLFWQA